MTFESDLLDQTIYLTIHGSRAYGTHRPDSDRDERGICILTDPRYYYGFQKFEQKDSDWSDGCDRVIFDIRKFVELALDCNPNIIEILFVNESSLLKVTDKGRMLRENREIFLSQKAAHTFVGYAMSQLHRLEGHYDWIQNPPNKPVPESYQKWVELFPESTPYQIELESHVFRVLPPKEGTIRMEHFDKGAFKNANKKYGQYLDWLKNRNPDRSKLEQAYGYDSKHAMHLCRLLRMGLEIVRDGEVHVLRPDAPELNDIRNGKFQYPELIDYAKTLKDQVEGCLDKSPLPKKPDYVKAEALLVGLIQTSIQPR